MLLSLAGGCSPCGAGGKVWTAELDSYCPGELIKPIECIVRRCSGSKSIAIATTSTARAAAAAADVPSIAVAYLVLFWLLNE
jgi:hypothetical protein